MEDETSGDWNFSFQVNPGQLLAGELVSGIVSFIGNTSSQSVSLGAQLDLTTDNCSVNGLRQ